MCVFIDEVAPKLDLVSLVDSIDALNREMYLSLILHYNEMILIGNIHFLLYFYLTKRRLITL
jgi:hypothetical protein